MPRFCKNKISKTNLGTENLDCPLYVNCNLFFTFIFKFLERGRERGEEQKGRERERESQQNQASHSLQSPTWGSIP